jgi:hypothetical protein
VSEQDPDEETIRRRSENADVTAKVGLEALGCAWILSCLALACLPFGMILH